MNTKMFDITGGRKEKVKEQKKKKTQTLCCLNM